MPKKLSPFETAFAAARKKGKSKFIFHGKSYTTELAKPKPKKWVKGVVATADDGGKNSNPYQNLSSDAKAKLKKAMKNLPH